MPQVRFTIPVPLEDGVEYRLNVYSLCEWEGIVAESEPYHVKVSRWAKEMYTNIRLRFNIMRLYHARMHVLRFRISPL